MRRTMIAATAAALAATPALLSAQAMSGSTRTETVFVKGTVTGEVPTGAYTITRSTTSYYVIPAPSITPSSSNMSSMPNSSDMSITTSTTEAPAKPTLDRKISHGAGEAAKDASKLGKKAAHGVKEAASDVKKKVTGKP